MARRLVEAGVTFVTVDAGGWDTHANNFEALKAKKPPRTSTRAWAASGARHGPPGPGRRRYARARLGRVRPDPPKINKDAGRDHWPGALSVVLSGGGLKMGQAVGSTDPRGELPRERPIAPEDVLATMYRHLGIDTDLEFLNDAQRPLKVLGSGRPIPELIG